MNLHVKYFKEDTRRLEKFDGGDWIDLSADEDITLKIGDFKLIPLGVAMQLPPNHEAHVAPRSSTFKHWGLIQTNGVGVVDESYCGDNDQWFMPVLATRDVEIKRGDRVCQFRIMEKMPTYRMTIQEVTELGNADRGGHGSTGKN